MTKRELVLEFIRDFYRSRTPIEIAEHELLEAQIARMDAESSVEYYVAMVQYNQKRIDRLNERLKDLYDRKAAIAQPDIRMDWNQRIDTINPGPIERIPTSGQGQTKI